jgi:hypothetical protein
MQTRFDARFFLRVAIRSETKGKKQGIVLLDIFGTIISSFKVKFMDWRRKDD